MVAKVTVRTVIDERALNEVMRGRTGDVGRVMAGFAGEVTKRLKGEMVARAGGAYWPVRSSLGQGGGDLRLTVTVGTTRPHTIVPVRARVLAFDAGGVRVYTHRVSHPGSSAPLPLIEQFIASAGDFFPPLSRI